MGDTNTPYNYSQTVQNDSPSHNAGYRDSFTDFTLHIVRHFICSNNGCLHMQFPIYHLSTTTSSSYATNKTVLVHLQLIHMSSYSDRRRSGRRSSSLHCRYSSLITLLPPNRGTLYGALYSSQSIPWLSSAEDCYLILFRGPNYLQTTGGTDQSVADPSACACRANGVELCPSSWVDYLGCSLIYVRPTLFGRWSVVWSFVGVCSVLRWLLLCTCILETVV